jgi:hypothetical protein
MKRIYLLTTILITLAIFQLQAQEKDSKEVVATKIELLKNERSKIELEEKNLLKNEIEAINKKLAKNLISEDEAKKLKEEAAKNRALNIKSRITIIDSKIDLLERNKLGNEKDYRYSDYGSVIRIGRADERSDDLIYIGGPKDDKPRKYDLRTKSDMVLAFGFNNAIIDDESFNDSPYKVGGSRFFEIGWGWKTRVFKESNFLRLKYGVSIQINGLKPNDNNYFVQDGDETYLEEFQYNLKKAKLSVTNLVFPIHFEIGSSKKIEREDYFRYSTKNRFKFGFGGYAGFNIGSRQKLKYKEDGDRKKDKIKNSYNTSNLVYGISSYVAFGDVAVYAKYDLTPIFKNQTVEQNNISLGLRFDMD